MKGAADMINYKEIARRQAIGKKQKEAIDLFFKEGVKLTFLSKESRENLIYRINEAFDEAFENDFQWESGNDDPNFSRFGTKPGIVFNDEKNVYIYDRTKTDSDFFIRTIE